MLLEVISCVVRKLGSNILFALNKKDFNGKCIFPAPAKSASPERGLLEAQVRQTIPYMQEGDIHSPLKSLVIFVTCT